MSNKKTPEVNSGSMADIAFLLLIFFLVTTSMDVDKGLARQLPPIAEKQQKTDVEIKKRNLLPIKINQRDLLLVGGKRMNISELKEKAKEFIRSDKTREDLPEFELTTIKGIKDPVEVSKGIISLQNDRGTTYNRYIEIQDILVQAYNELRDEASFQYFQKKFDDLKPAQQNAIKLVYPQRISEAEPKNIGGK